MTTQTTPSLDDLALFLDTALQIICEYELYAEGIVARPVSVVPSPWFDGAKGVVCAVCEARERACEEQGVAT